MKAPVAHDGYGRVAVRLLKWGGVIALPFLFCLGLPWCGLFHDTERWKRRQVVDDVSALREAARGYRTRSGAWPSESRWAQELVRVPEDPWGHPYLYRLGALDTAPSFGSVGRDGVEGTEDDVWPR